MKCTKCVFENFECDIQRKSSFRDLTPNQVQFVEAPEISSTTDDWPKPPDIEFGAHKNWVRTYRTLSNMFSEFAFYELEHKFRKMSDEFRFSSASSRETKILLFLYRYSNNFGNSALLPACWYLVVSLFAFFAYIAAETHSLYFFLAKQI